MGDRYPQRLAKNFLAEYPGARVIDSPNRWNNRLGYSGPLTLVLHATSGFGSARAVAEYFANDASNVSSNFVIGKTPSDGIYQCCPLDCAAGANWNNSSGTNYWPSNAQYNGNAYTISVELHKYQGNGEALTTYQMDTLIDLTKFLHSKKGILLKWCDSKAGGITTHGFFSPTDRSNVNGYGGDPGTFDWSRYWKGISNMSGAALTDEEVTDYFDIGPVDSFGNHIWILKSNKSIILKEAFRVFFASLHGDASSGGKYQIGLPIENEKTVSPSYWTQRCERAAMACEWPDHKIDHPPGSGDCYLQHIESYYKLPELQAEHSYLQQQLVSIRAENMALTHQLSALQEQKKDS